MDIAIVCFQLPLAVKIDVSHKKRLDQISEIIGNRDDDPNFGLKAIGSSSTAKKVKLESGSV